MKSEKTQWLRLALQLKGSVLKQIYIRVLLCGVFDFLVSVLYYLKYPVSQPLFGSIVPSIVLGLLLVFRTNTAYEKFWEGRRWWGVLVTNVRNLAWEIWVAVAETQLEDRANKIAALRLLAAFPVATKLYLRSEAVNSELEEFMTPSRYLQLKTAAHPPLQIAFWIGDYLQQEYNRKCLNKYQLTTTQALVKSMMETLGNCERILKTPIPLAYTIHIKQLLLFYCLLLPFQFVKDLGWWTGAFVALVSFTLFGVEAIGIEIENPFGYDANDLPLDAICATIKLNIEDFISVNSSADFRDNKMNNLQFEQPKYTQKYHQQNLENEEK